MRDTPVYLYFSVLITVAIVCLAGCGENDDETTNQNDDPPGMTPVEEACLHAREDHPLTRQATADRDDASANIAETHTHFRIELPENEDEEFAGYVVYDVDRDAEYGLFASADIPLSFLDGEGEALEAQSEAVDECPEITTLHSVQLEAGEYFVHFGPSAHDEISTVTERLTESH